jgi:exopolysaccharide biosynthesis polyprenyl glycosylphosphotransferase
MLGRNQRFEVRGLQVLDALLVAAALWLAHFLRDHIIPRLPGMQGSPIIAPFEDFIWMWFIILPLAPILLAFHGFYLPRGARVWPALRSMITLLLVLALALTLQRLSLSRGVLLLMTPIGLTLLLLRESVLRRMRESRSQVPERQERVLLCGATARLPELGQRLAAAPEGRYVQALQFDLSTQSVEELLEILHAQNVNRVVISAAGLVFDRVSQALRACEIEGVEVALLADFYQPSIARASLDEFLGQPSLVLRSAPAVSWELAFKALIDRVLAAVALILFSPLLLLIAAGIRLTSPGPILFRQKRGGLHGRPFTMWKFRSMTTNAEMQQVELLAFNQMSGPVFKVDKDPRVTPIGRLLRRTSLDELPQLWNILRGEMSLVGPRPLPLYEVEKFPDLAHRRRLSMKPGLTCLWQIAGRNQVTSFEDWVRLDLQYIDNWSLWLDLTILLRTIPAVLLGRGAS